MDAIHKYFNDIFGMTAGQYETYKRLMNTPADQWPEPGRTELFGVNGLFNRLGTSYDFVTESIAQYVVKHYPGGG